MPNRQEKFLSSSQKRKTRSGVDVDKTADDGNDFDEEPSTSKKRIKKGPKLDLENIFLSPSKKAEERVKHDLFPNFNLSQLPVEDFSELKNYPNCTVSIPHPVYVANKHCESVDPCHRRTIARENYIKLLLHARTAYLKAMKRDKNLRKNQVKNDQHHNSLFDFAERLEMNPDPYFNGSYDFYYTAGNLCVLSNSSYVVHAGGKNLQELNISRLSNKENITHVPLRQLHSETLPQSSDILQVMPFITNREDRPNCFITRQRNTISLFTYRGENKLKAISQYNNKTTPFISFAQMAGDSNKFILTNMKQHVRLFDLNSNKSVLSKVYDVTESNTNKQWNIVRSWRKQSFLYANTKEIFMMDLRTEPKEWQKTRCGFGDGNFVCENISNILPSEFKKQIYVATSHKLYCLDTRCWGQQFEGPATICCWQHQLEYPPLLLDSFRDFSSEFIAVSSPMADDLRICELTRAGRIVPKTTKKTSKKEQNEPKYHYKSLSLPFQPPTLHEAYESARLKGKCLRPYSDIQQRLNCATTGLAFYASPAGNYEQTLLFTSNSNGDVFAHQFKQRDSQEDEPRTSALTDDVIAKYDETINKIIQPNLNFTQINHLKAMSKVFRCPLLSSMKSEFSNLVENGNVDSGTPKRRKLGRWQKPMQVLHSYKDALVSNMLSIWDIDYVDENDIKMSELKKELSIKPDPVTAVNSWLESMNTEPPMISIPTLTLNDSSVVADISLNAFLPVDFTAKSEFSQSFSNLPQSTQLLDEFAPQLDMLVEEQPTTSTAVDKNVSARADTSANRNVQAKKKRTTYVKGF